MDLREAIRIVIRELAGEELRKLVREVLVEDLVAENPRVTAAKKAAATRAANKSTPNGAFTRGGKAVPVRAKQFGVFIGQKYKGKKSAVKIRHRLIEVVRLDENGICPKILGSAGKNAKAKRISYEHLQRNYERVD
jgi:hypothetical protein